MRFWVLGSFRRWFGLLLLLGFAAGCVASPISPRTASTVADVIAGEVQVNVIRAQGEETPLEKGGAAGVQVEDVVRLNESGQGLLRFGDRLEVDLLRTTEVRLVEVREEAGSAFIRLHQAFGNVHVHLNSEASVVLTLETDFATVTTLEPGTDIFLCHKPEVITCGVVRQGAVEFVAQGQKQIARQGEAVFVRPGQTPSGSICVQDQQFTDWLDAMRGTDPQPGLGEVVNSWPQVSCAEAAQATAQAAAPTPALPSPTGMVKIEAGQYEVGSAYQDNWHTSVQQVNLPAYWIDQYEVTVAQYRQFAAADGRPMPELEPEGEDLPIRGVAWSEAAAYCVWVGKRLPSEAEWEVAGRGPGPNPPLYPWGSDPSAGGLARDLPLSEPYPVGAISFNKSVLGVYDLAGNVWEWVGDPYERAAEGRRILRGGRHGLIRDLAYRQPALPDDPSFLPFAGFRCAAGQVGGG